MSFRNKKKHRSKSFGGFEKLGKLEEAEFLMEGKEWFDAFWLLQEAVKKWPVEGRFWEMLADVSADLNQVPTLQKALRKLVELFPNRAETLYLLALSYGLNNRIALGCRTFRAFLDKFPDDENAAIAAQLLANSEPDVNNTLAGYGFPEGERGLEMLCLNDEAQVLMRQGEYRAAREKAELLIGQMPDYAPAYNNLSLISYLEGDVEKAYETAKKLLAKQPENFHALSNLVRYSVFLGHEDEAREYANGLLPIENDDQDIWIKKIEAFTFIGDDQTVIAVYNAAVKATKASRLDNFGKHLAAYAYYRLGDEKEARKLWKKIPKHDPNFDYAADNLEELELPEDERDIVGMPLDSWLPKRFIDELMQESISITDSKNFDRNLRKKVRTYFAKYPGIHNLFSVFLERGDEMSRTFSVKMLGLAATPESHSALKEFAFSQNGHDSLRYEAARILADAEVISNQVRLWNRGEWREMRMMTYEITSRPLETYPLKPKAAKLSEKGYYAMQDQNVDLAEQYFDMAIKANGANHPSILFNLLTVGQLRGNGSIDEAELRKIVEDFPNYTLGAIRLAMAELGNGNVETAKHLVEKFYDKKLWHIGEILLWFHFKIEMALEEKDYASARTSLDAWDKVDENLDYQYWDDRISEQEFLSTSPLFRQSYSKAE